jgi:hypothetical protein
MKTTNEADGTRVDRRPNGGIEGDEPRIRPISSDGRKTVYTDFERFGAVNARRTISSYA